MPLWGPLIFIAMLQLSFNSTQQLSQVASQLLSAFPNQRFFAFFGAMGVGKTTLIKQLCAQLGVCQNVCSPTFAIINEYSTPDGDPVYHFDFYRLKNLDEAYDLGYEEYFYSGCYCFTEWTEKIEPILPESYLRISIHEQQGLRTLTAEEVSL